MKQVNDYFSQAAIDFLLGNANAQVFEDFEQSMISSDPAISMQKVRANAIETSSKIVIADQGEDFVGGWILMSPHEQNTVRTFPFEEIVLLVTHSALYNVRFDWNLEKVKSFERLEFRSIIGIMKGSYITSTLAFGQMDAKKNVGLLIKYKRGNENIARVNTRSLSNTIGRSNATKNDVSSVPGYNTALEDSSSLKILAFKAPPARSSSDGVEGEQVPAMSERELVNHICDEIQRVALSDLKGVQDLVEERDIISLDEAKKSTGLLEQWGHSIKKLVWA